MLDPASFAFVLGCFIILQKTWSPNRLAFMIWFITLVGAYVGRVIVHTWEVLYVPIVLEIGWSLAVLLMVVLGLMTYQPIQGLFRRETQPMWVLLFVASFFLGAKSLHIFGEGFGYLLVSGYMTLFFILGMLGMNRLLVSGFSFRTAPLIPFGILVVTIVLKLI
ncbi:hypothetical protein [Salsuginibacillus kocurii]|uniref:hypothetical protein n=1 Tax=Salsuginibacillus kocurii TaxID=427078 RepID=UPI000382BEF2|nr:hypothetical protein [Salsuginibacillus kocurii]